MNQKTESMTLQQLQEQVVRTLSNQCFVRHWGHFNHPRQSPWEMAVSCVGMDGRCVEVRDLEDRGFEKRKLDDRIYYVIARIDDEGRPFSSTL